MKLAIMQPYFFPYAGYFSLAKYADEFILFDTPQYDRKGWMHRNRILKPTDGWQYIHAGIRKPDFLATINSVLLDPDKDWKETLLAQLDHYRKSSRNFSVVLDLLQGILASPVTTLVEFNKVAFGEILLFLGINRPLHVFSEMAFDIGQIDHPGQWALRIAEACGASEYVNPVGGQAIFDKSEFDSKNIRLTFLKHQLPPYKQNVTTFEPALSVLDVLMFLSKEDTLKYLDEYDIL